ncbi:MAG TPA: MFS transporter [Caulobacteraceae bacterium]|nr:MFS transporter [Caulobacteraceae bacterium]
MPAKVALNRARRALAALPLPAAEPVAATPRDSRAALYTLLSVMFINMLGFGIIVPLLPFYGASFRAPPWAIALVFSAYSMGSFIGEPFWGRLSDRVGRKPILVWTIGANCACYGLLAFAPTILAAFLIRFFGGMAAGNGSVVQGYIADVTPVEDRPGRLARLGAAYNLGFILGPFVGGTMAKTSVGPIGFQIPLLAASGLAGLSAIGIALVVRESRARSPVQTRTLGRWRMFGFAARHPVVGRILALTFIAGFAFTGIESTFGLWAQHRFGWQPRTVGLCFGVSGAVSAFTQFFITGQLSRRYGQGRMLALGMAGTALTLAAQPFSGGSWRTIALMATTSACSSVAFPNSSALISGSVDPDNQGQVMGLNNATSAFARFTGPFCASLVFAGLSVDGPFFLGALVIAPAILLALAAGRAASAGPTLLSAKA